MPVAEVRPFEKNDTDRVVSAMADAIAAPAAERPCWHLSPICVEPSSRGKGVGKALMDTALRSTSGLPALLSGDTTREKCGVLPDMRLPGGIPYPGPGDRAGPLGHAAGAPRLNPGGAPEYSIA